MELHTTSSTIKMENLVPMIMALVRDNQADERVRRHRWLEGRTALGIVINPNVPSFWAVVIISDEQILTVSTLIPELSARLTELSGKARGVFILHGALDGYEIPEPHTIASEEEYWQLVRELDRKIAESTSKMTELQFILAYLERLPGPPG